MKIRRHKNNKLFRFIVHRVDWVPMKGCSIKGANPVERKEVSLGKRMAVGSCWPSVERGLLFGTDRQFRFSRVECVGHVA